MNPRYVFFLTLLMTFVLTASPLCAADKPNMTGTWKLNVEKSDLGGAPVQKLVVDVTHKEPVFKYAVTGETTDGQPINEAVELTIDGKERPSEIAGGGKITVSWEGPALLVKFTADNGQFSMVVKFALSADGKTATRDATMNGPDGESKRHEIYEKQ